MKTREGKNKSTFRRITNKNWWNSLCLKRIPETRVSCGWCVGGPDLECQGTDEGSQNLLGSLGSQDIMASVSWSWFPPIPCQSSCDLSKGAPKEWSLEHWSATATGLWWRTRKAHKLPIETLHLDLFRKSSHLMCRGLTMHKFLHKYISCGWLLYKS